MEFNISNARRSDDSVIKFGDQDISRSECFKYLGLIVQKDGGVGKDVPHIIQAGWFTWRGASRILCDHKVPLKLKGKFYHTEISSAMLYGSECWALNYVHEQKMGVAEMTMLSGCMDTRDWIKLEMNVSGIRQEWHQLYRRCEKLD